MGVRHRVLQGISATAPAVMRRLPAANRQRLVVELIRAVDDVSTVEERLRLHLAAADQGTTWPATRREAQEHIVGLYALVAETAEVPGAIAEFGVAHGRSLVALARANARFSPGREVFGFDSFEGFPELTTDDVGGRVSTPGKHDIWCARTSVAMVDEALDAPATLVKGFFEDTLPHPGLDAISLLHVDADLYESTKVVLERCLPLMGPGSVIILDEYAEQEFWPGATKAIDEVLEPTPYRAVWDDLLNRHVVRL